MICLKLSTYSKTEIGALINVLRTASESLEGASDAILHVKEDIDSALYYAMSLLVEQATKKALGDLLAKEEYVN